MDAFHDSVETISKAFPRDEKLYTTKGKLKHMKNALGMQSDFLSLDDVLMKTREVSTEAMKKLSNAMSRFAESSEYPGATQQHALSTWEYLATQVDQFPMISTTIDLIASMESLQIMIPAKHKEACKYFTMVSRAAYCVHEAMDALQGISDVVANIIKDDKFDSYSADLTRSIQKLSAATKKTGPPLSKPFTEAYGKICSGGQEYYETLGKARIAKNKDAARILLC